MLLLVIQPGTCSPLPKLLLGPGRTCAFQLLTLFDHDYTEGLHTALREENSNGSGNSWVKPTLVLENIAYVALTL